MKIINKHWKKLMILLLSFLLALGGFTMAHFSDRLSQTIKITTGNYADVNYVPLSEMTPGSTIMINENGSPVEFYVATHDYESNLNEAGRTLLVRKDCYDKRQWNTSNINTYASSSIDSWLNGDYKSILDSDVQDAMGSTKFYYTPGRGNNIVTTLERSVFLLSATELGQSGYAWFNVEGSPLQIASTLQIAYINGSAVDQWTRSPDVSDSEKSVSLRSTGVVYYYGCTNTFGSRPCFTLPGTLLINDNTGKPDFEKSSVTLTGIEVTTAPTKTTYNAGDNFVPAGMVITATYADGTKKAVTEYTVTDGSELTEGQTSVTISYTENGVTKTVTQEITVEKALAKPILAEQDTWYKGSTGKSTITEISLVNSYTPTYTETESWDASTAGDGSVMAYLSGTTLTLAGNGSGKIIANTNSSYAFSGQDSSNRFTSLQTISGLDLLDTSQVSNMKTMFYNCSGLTGLDVSGFDTSQVTDMSWMFAGCSTLTDLDLSGFDTSQVTTMTSMFNGCGALSSLDLSDWDTSQVTDMSSMFYNCNGLTSLDVSNWVTSQVTNMKTMFYTCSSLTGLDVSSFDTSQVTDMSWMFAGCSTLNGLDLSGFDTSQVTLMRAMFQNCNALVNLDVSGFKTSNVTDMAYMFQKCNSLNNLNVSGFNTSKVVNMSYMFQKCNSLTYLDVSGFKTSLVTTMSSMFDGCEKLTVLDVSGFDTSKTTDMSFMFNSCNSLNNLDVSDFDTSQVTNMKAMFQFCSTLTSLDVSHFNTSNVTNMGWMFFSCDSLSNLDVSGFVTSQVTNMSYMFYSCNSLASLDVSGFDTSQVTDMSWMFYNCKGLTSLDLSNWVTSQVTNMKAMFYFCTGLSSLDVSGFDTSKTTNMSFMFDFCSTLTGIDLSGFDTSQVTDMSSMFYYCPNLTTIYASELWSTANITNSSKMFSDCIKLVGQISYDSSKIDATYANYTTGYLTYKSAPATLTGLEIATAPTKTTYAPGENFDPAGMVVEAVYSDDSKKAVTDYTVTDGSGLTDGQTTVTISYTERGVTKTVTQAITVKTVSYATLSELSPGSTIRLNESGSPVEFYVATHDYESGLNGSGRTLLVRKDCYDTRKMADVLNFAYPSSDMDTWLNGDYKALLDANVQAATEMTKLYSYVECGDDAVTTLERSVFLLSLAELGMTYNNYDGADGTTLPIASTLQIAYLNGSASSQWTRSTQAGSNNGIYYLNKSGVVYTYASSGKYGSRPCFTLPGTLLINEDTSEPDFEKSSTILADIIIDTPPDMTTYTPGENFDPAGMVVKAVYRDGSRKTITDYTVIDGTDLAEGQTTVTISYTEDGVTKTVSQEITAKTITSVTLSELTPGSTIKLNESGSPVEFYVATHDYESDLNGAGRTLLVRKDCYDQRAMYSSIISLSNKYAGSSMDTWLNGDYKALLDSEVQAAIGTTQFYYTVEGSPATLTTLERSVFLLSLTEFGKEASYASVEGSALPIASTLQIGYISGSAVNQWTRSPALSTGNYFCMMSSSGSTNKYTSQSKIGSRPAFTLPGTLLMDEETGQPVFDQSTVTSAEN